MKRISHLLFLSVFLASCADAVTPTPVVTKTSAPTATLTPTDTPQPTPTETPDPNMPPDATGQDGEGNYIMTEAETGITYTWFDIQYGNDAAEGIKGHWFENRMANGEDIFLYNDKLVTGGDGFRTDSVPFSQFVLQGNGQLQARYVLRHPDQMSEFGPGTPLESQSVSSQLYWFLGARFNHKIGKDVLPDEWRKFNALIVDGSASIPIGDDLWILSKGYREYVVDYNVAAKDPSFQKTDEFYWKIMVVDGQLVAIIATSEPNKMSDQDHRIMAFAPIWEVILNDPFIPGQNVKSFWGGLGRKAAAEWSQLGGGENKTYPNVTTQPTTDFLEVDYSE